MGIVRRFQNKKTEEIKYLLFYDDKYKSYILYDNDFKKNKIFSAGTINKDWLEIESEEIPGQETEEKYYK